MDLAEGHVAALAFMDRPTALPTPSSSSLSLSSPSSSSLPGGRNAYNVFNLGSGVGYTVLEIIAAMKVLDPLLFLFTTH